MQVYMPMLVVRTREATAAVELNGTIVGEASPDQHLAVPLSDSGEYYIGIYPLRLHAERYFPVVRKLLFTSGELQPVESGDVEAYAWPDGVFEAVFTPGTLPHATQTTFPFTIDQVELRGNRIATLYFDNGLKFVIEGGARVLFGAVLGAETTGKIVLQKNGLLIVFAGEAAIDGAPEDYARTALVLDADLNELLRIADNAVGMRSEDELLRFSCLSTMQRHEKKWLYVYQDGSFTQMEPEIGFFMHSPSKPEEGEEMIRAFCEAVQYELWDEALSYLSPALRAGLDQGLIRACMGEFTGIRAPLVRQHSAIGLLYPAEGGITPVRVFTFSFEDGLIDNLSED